MSNPPCLASRLKEVDSGYAAGVGFAAVALPRRKQLSDFGSGLRPLASIFWLIQQQKETYLGAKPPPHIRRHSRIDISRQTENTTKTHEMHQAFTLVRT